MISVIRNGAISNDLLREQPGPLSQARWLTTASRRCRLYVSTEEPSPELPDDIKNIVWPVIQKNAYWAHEENVLLAMLADADLSTRQAAIARIKTIRQSPSSTQQQVRQ